MAWDMESSTGVGAEVISLREQVPMAGPQIKSGDPIWSQIRREAEMVSASEPVMASLVYATVLSERRFEDAVSHRLAQRLKHSVDAGLLHKTFQEALAADPSIGDMFRADIMAVAKRDPACRRLIEPLLYFKGFHALEAYRFSHWLWHAGREDFALYLQSLSSRVLQVDIHPAARIGKGVMLDHATGIVIGETAVIGDNCSLLHGVTLGGTGNEFGDRHPKIGSRRDDGLRRQDPRQHQNWRLRARCRRQRRAPRCAAAAHGRRRSGA